MSNEFRLLTRDDCLRAIAEHELELVLFDRFWNFMAKQSELGAPYEYVSACYEILEKVWKSKKEKERNDKS